MTGHRPWRDILGCVVVVLCGDVERRCGMPVAGERAGFPMCAEHYDLFDPAMIDG